MKYNKFFAMFNPDTQRHIFQDNFLKGVEADLLRRTRQIKEGTMIVGKNEKEIDLNQRAAKLSLESFEAEMKTLLSKRSTQDVILDCLANNPVNFFNRFWFYLDWDAPGQKNGKNYAAHHRNITARQNPTWRTSLPFWFVSRFENIENLSKAAQKYWQSEIKKHIGQDGKIIPSHAQYLLESAKSFIAAEGFLYLKGFEAAKSQLEKAEKVQQEKPAPRHEKNLKYWQDNFEKFKKGNLYTYFPEYKQISDAVKAARQQAEELAK